MYKLKRSYRKRRIIQTEQANKAKVIEVTISNIEKKEEVEVKICTLENLAKA